MTTDQLTKSPCCNADIRREGFDDAMQGFCTGCGKEVDRVEGGVYKITAPGYAAPSQTAPAQT